MTLDLALHMHVVFVGTTFMHRIFLQNLHLRFFLLFRYLRIACSLVSVFTFDVVFVVTFVVEAVVTLLVVEAVVVVTGLVAVVVVTTGALFTHTPDEEFTAV